MSVGVLADPLFTVQDIMVCQVCSSFFRQPLGDFVYLKYCTLEPGSRQKAFLISINFPKTAAAQHDPARVKPRLVLPHLN